MKKRRTSDPIGVKQMTQEQVNAKYSSRKRIGKTQRDKAKVKEE